MIAACSLRRMLASYLLVILAVQVPARLVAQEAELPIPAKPGRFIATTRSSDVNRVAHLQIPTGYNANTPPPLVLVFHGAGGNGRVMLDHCGWSAKAEKTGFVVVAPDGLPALSNLPANFRTNPALWNSGQLNSRSPRTGIDDVAYVRKLLDELKERVPYDPDRVFCCGHSNGGGMTFRLATELAERFAAVATVAGMMAMEDPHPKKPLPTLYILGTKDPLVPIEGGDVRLPWATRRNPPIAEPLAAWAKAIGCEVQPKTLSDKDHVKKQEYPSKSNGPTLTVLLLEGHGHVWPGSKSLLPEETVGPSTSRLNATDTIWEFFSTVSRPAK